MASDRKTAGGQASAAERGIGTPERIFRRGPRAQGKIPPASEAGKQDQDRQKPPRDNAGTRLNEILDDLRKAGLTPAELKTEAQNVSKKSWRTVVPTIRKPGSEIWISFNPELETDDTYQRFVVHPPPNAVVVKTSFRDNEYLSDELKIEIEHLKATDPDEYKFKDAVIAILAVVAKQERIRRSERASAAIARLRRQGQADRLGRKRNVFDRDHARRLKAKGWSIRQIAAELGQSAMTRQRAVTAINRV